MLQINVFADNTVPEIYSDEPVAGDVNSDGVLNIQDFLRLSKHFAGWNVEFDSDIADVTGDGVLNLQDLLRLAKYFAGWDVVLEAPAFSGPLTRGRWINMLLGEIDAEVSRSDSVTNYYGDTEGHRYEDQIEAAKNYGIIPAVADEQDVPIFNPDEPATREFAAITAVLAMGYVCTEDDIECLDKDDLEYPEIATVAEKIGFVALEDGYFYPDRALTSDEKDQIFSTISDIAASASITEEIEEVTYSGDAIVEALSDISDYSIVDNGDGTYVVTLPDNENSRQITEGSYFVLPANGIYLTNVALKAVTVSVSGNNLVINAATPEDVSKVISEVVFSGEATPIVDGVEVLDENITYSYDPDGVVGDGMTLSGVGGSFAVPGKWTFDFGNGIKLGEHAKLKGSAEVTIPDITAYLDASFGLFSFDVNEVTVSVTENAAIKGEIEYTVAESMMSEFHSGSKEFARVPFALGATGLSIDLVFSVYYDVKGSLSIVYKVEATQGIQYKDDTFRFIHNFDSDIDIGNLEFSGQIGLQAAINLVFCTIWDIVGISGRIGAAATASIENHVDEDLQCIDGTIYVSAKASLNEETLIGSYLKEYKHYTLEKEIYNKENSPFKLNIHFENGEKVPECTYGKGHIEGYVYDAVNREPIRYARITVYVGDDLKAVKYTDSEGKYSVESGLPVGEITIKISATGYQTYSDTRTISRNTVTYIESYLMVSRTEISEGSVSGSFINALTGGNVQGVTYEIRRGWNNTSGDYVASSVGNGSYNVTLPAGNYTVYATKEGFIPGSVNVTVVANATARANVTLSPEDTGDLDTSLNMRFILTWGETPRDLDSHLFGPDGYGYTFHTYYSAKNHYSDGELRANLDLDDTSSYGPETTTIYKADSGIYSYYVHDYTNRSSSTSKAMSNSGTKIEVYNGTTLHATFNVPANVPGTVWHVFDYNPETGLITPVNRMYFSSDPSSLGLYEETDTAAIPEQLAIEMIAKAAEQEKEQ